MGRCREVEVFPWTTSRWESVACVGNASSLATAGFGFSAGVAYGTGVQRDRSQRNCSKPLRLLMFRHESLAPVRPQFAADEALQLLGGDDGPA